VRFLAPLRALGARVLIREQLALQRLQLGHFPPGQLSQEELQKLQRTNVRCIRLCTGQSISELQGDGTPSFGSTPIES
jgi:hypothetical protein